MTSSPSLVVEGVVRVPEGLAEELAAVQASIMLAGNGLDQRHLQPAGDLLEEPHPVGVLSRVLAVVRQVPGEEDEIGALREAVDLVHRLLERLGAEGVGRPRKPHVRVGELNEREGSRGFSILLAEQRRDSPAAGGGAEKRGHGEERTHPDRGAGDLHKGSSVNRVFHLSSLEAANLLDGAVVALFVRPRS
jgi:hypothetical protein